jgi:hypothetical protein
MNDKQYDRQHEHKVDQRADNVKDQERTDPCEKQ